MRIINDNIIFITKQHVRIYNNHFLYRCIKHFLKSKTRILVTHQLQYLSEVDKIVIMDKVCVCQRHIYINPYVYIIYTYKCLYIYIYIYIYTCVIVCVCVCVCVYVRTSTHVGTHVN